MSKGKIGAIAAAVIVVLILFSGYNSLVTANEEINGKWSQVENQLQRRSDLIPNLVSTVKGSAAHEREALEAVIAARAQGLSANGVSATAQADGMLTGALRGLLAVAEAYPDLKASANFLSLQEELAGTENKIAFSRQRYNDTVRTLNTAIEAIPTRFVAGLAKATPAEFYEAPAEAREVPRVEF